MSGGCLELDLCGRAAATLSGGEAVVVVYDLSAENDIVWGLGLGCGGEVHVLIERLPESPDQSHLQFARLRLENRERIVQATVFGRDSHNPGAPDIRPGGRFSLASGGLTRCDVRSAQIRTLLDRDARRVLNSERSAVRSYALGKQKMEVFYEFIEPPLSLLICGADEESRELVAIAVRLGWTATVIDHRPSRAAPERFPGANRVFHWRPGKSQAPVEVDRRTAVVVLSHNYRADLEYLQAFLRSDAGYIGLLGARERAKRLINDLPSEIDSDSGQALSRVFSPIGIDIGADTPEEIALSIAAEIQAVFSGRKAGFLRDRKAPIHSSIDFEEEICVSKGILEHTTE
ncbi:MAG: XdhC family protein [Candidatus Zixiibacteriota bacterium]